MAIPIIVNEVVDERLEEVYTLNAHAVQLVENGRTFESIERGSFHCAVGKHAYLSGIHRIRIKLHHGSAFFGIRPRNIRLEPDDLGNIPQYQNSPSTYGWYTSAGRVVNGRFDGVNLELFDSHELKLLDRENAIFTLTLNCDEHRLSMMINESCTERDEMEVNPLHAPFPWCLFIQLNHIGARVSLV